MFNIGYHAEHHSFPHVHWSELPALHAEAREELIADGAHVVPFGYLRGGLLLSRTARGDADARAVDAAHFERLQRVYLDSPTNAYYRPRITLSEGAAEIEVDVREDLYHAAHAVHGSHYFKVLDDSAFFAANSIITDVFVLTVSFHVHFLRPVSSGTLHASGKLVHRSRRLLVAESVLVDDEGRVLGRGSGSFRKSAIALTPEIGYR
ncbi:MAG: hotdog fold thioesterase [bacterium]|nr:hotdog fold thioesterase [bacterium]